MLVTKFDKPTARLVGEAMLKALQVEAAKFGLKVEPQRGTFGAGEFIPKYRFVPIAPADDALTLEQQALDVYAPLDGFKDVKVLTSTTIKDRNNDEFRVVGYNPRAPKMPYIVENLTRGVKQKCGPDFVRFGLRRAGVKVD